ncbi:MAG: mechanosensitive ion channel [Halioglobus sp.]|nr:mechanosensitive ion channel [Halioglobus sp.]
MKTFARMGVFAIALLLLHPAAFAEKEYVARTAKNVDISIDDLNAMLLPLTQAQLEVEATAWRKVLTRKVAQISKLEIMKRNSPQTVGLIDQVGEQLKDSVGAVVPATGSDAGADAAGSQADAAAAKASAELDTQIAVMRVEQGGINKRFGIVLDALESKGGSVEEQRLYLSAVSGIKLNVDDTAAGLLAVKEWLKSADGGQLLLINLLKFIAVIAFVVFLSRMVGRLTDRMISRKPVSMLLENFMKVAVRRTVFAIGFIAALPIIGIDVGPVLALIGAAGLVVGLALQGTLSNFASGVLILIYRPYDMNDAISVAGVSGTVSTMNLLYTTIKTFDNQLITIPNNNVWGDTIINITGSDERRVDMVFGIGYGDDFGKAQEILASILAAHPKVLKTPEPKIRLHELADSSVNLICRPWAKTADYWDVYWDVMETVKREFDKQGISIPFPQRDVHFFPAPEASGSGEKTA